MCTYCNTTNYRKIYENHNGIIPKESNGRTYEIHHIDGNHSNNHTDNLTAVTIQEHYNIHYSQGDWAACLKIGAKMKLSPNELSAISSRHSQQMVKNGTHPFMVRPDGSSLSSDRVKNGTHHLLADKNGNSLSKKRVEDGTHHWLGGEIQSKVNQERIKAGTHNWLGENNSSHKRVKEGTHNFCSSEFQSNVALQRVKDGTHHFVGKNSPNKTRCSCIWCKKETNLPVLARDHSEKKCKEKLDLCKFL